MAVRSLSEIRRIYRGCAGFGQIFRSFSLNIHHYSPQTIETSDSNQLPLVTIANLGQAPRKIQKASSPRRVRARIPSPVWVLRHLSGKARGLRILLVWKGRATPPGGMDRRPNRGRYSCANPKVTTTFCISPCTPISYTSYLRPTAVSRLNSPTIRLKRSKHLTQTRTSSRRSLISDRLLADCNGVLGLFQLI